MNERVTTADGLVPAARATFHVDGDIVLLSQSNDLYVLNETAALLWQALADGASPHDAIAALAAAADRGPTDVEPDCNALFAAWERAGLLGLSQRGSALPPQRPEPWPARQTLPAAREPTYRLNDFAFRLRADDPQDERAARAYVAYLETSPASSPGWLLDIQASPSRLHLLCNGRAIDSCPKSELIPMLHGNLMMGAYHTSDRSFGVHAAAVTLGGSCALLAGIPGAGKSTLTAGLLSAGFRYSADDTILLAGQPLAVFGVTLPLGIKEGAWSFVGKLWPQLLESPILRRGDGKLVRYWLPPLDRRHATRERLEASALLFPRYRAGVATVETRLRRSEALAKLAEAGYDAPSRLDPEAVGKLLNWLGTVHCVELVYSDLGEAATRIAAILREPLPDPKIRTRV